MTWRIIVESEAEAEILEAAAWYNRSGPSLRDAFLSAVDASLAAIKDNPLQYQVVRGRARRAMIYGFPYALMYFVTEDEAIVTVCLHSSRDPKRWQTRFPT